MVAWVRSIAFMAGWCFTVVTSVRIVADEIDYRVNPRWEKKLGDGWPEDEEVLQKIEDYKKINKGRFS